MSDICAIVFQRLLTANVTLDCSMDLEYFEVREGNRTSPLLGLFCGNQLPSQVSRGHSLWVKFRSNAQGAGGGFRAQFQTGWFM